MIQENSRTERKRIKSQTIIDTTKKGYVPEMMVHEYIPYCVYDLTKNTEVNYKDSHKFFPFYRGLWVLLFYSGSEFGRVTCSGQWVNSKCGINRLKNCLCIGVAILLQFMESYNCHVKKPRKTCWMIKDTQHTCSCSPSQQHTNCQKCE